MEKLFRDALGPNRQAWHQVYLDRWFKVITGGLRHKVFARALSPQVMKGDDIPKITYHMDFMARRYYVDEMFGKLHPCEISAAASNSQAQVIYHGAPRSKQTNIELKQAQPKHDRQRIGLDWDGICMNCRKGDIHILNPCQRPSVCLRCNEEGHFVKQCPQPPIHSMPFGVNGGNVGKNRRDINREEEALERPKVRVNDFGGQRGHRRGGRRTPVSAYGFFYQDRVTERESFKNETEDSFLWSSKRTG